MDLDPTREPQPLPTLSTSCNIGGSGSLGDSTI